jgi:hypothetical protein
MHDQLQRDYTANIYTPELHQGFVKHLNDWLGMTIEYRICEMPVFVSKDLQHKLEEASVAIVEECVQPEYLAKTAPAMQARYTVPNQHATPLFATVDFAVSQNPKTGEFEPKLIEMQGFPSLFGYQFVYSVEALKWYALNEKLLGGKLEQELGHKLDFVLSGKTPDDYIALMKRVLLAGHHPDNVALLEYQPEIQKTRPDFICTERLTGIQATDICSVKKEGRKLYHQRGGEWLPIHRIYNRAIVDELDENNVALPFAWTDDLDVEWAGHPNWYFLMSKFSLPFLKHKSVPKTFFLHELAEPPADIENYVLKPLFAFAGKGVNVNPTREDVLAVPADDRANWILQERVHYADCIYTPDGMNKAEIRILLVWEDGSPRPTPIISLLRTGRGAMMGARFNTVPWTGTSSCFFA